MRASAEDAGITSSSRLLQGKEGVHLRKSKFELIEDGFVQNSGLKQLSYQASGRTAITGGDMVASAGVMLAVYRFGWCPAPMCQPREGCPTSAAPLHSCPSGGRVLCVLPLPAVTRTHTGVEGWQRLGQDLGSMLLCSVPRPPLQAGSTLSCSKRAGSAAAGRRLIRFHPHPPPALCRRNRHGAARGRAGGAAAGGGSLGPGGTPQRRPGVAAGQAAH